jgi:hypothetical protein
MTPAAFLGEFHPAVFLSFFVGRSLASKRRSLRPSHLKRFRFWRCNEAVRISSIRRSSSRGPPSDAMKQASIRGIVLFPAPSGPISCRMSFLFVRKWMLSTAAI